MFDPGSWVVVACSGGPDSLCLLHALARIQRLLKVELACFHFDHRLRKGSALDAAYVRAQAGRLAVPFFLRQAESKPERGESVEAWARTVRYQALLELADEIGGVAATGHTSDDQAETVLLALVRGGGLDALSGMKPLARPIVRPLIHTSREETEAFCRALRLRPRRDPMNEDPTYLRVAVRKRVIPQLERAVGRGVRSTLVRTAELLRADAELLDRLADDAARDVIAAEGDDVLLRREPLTALPTALSTRLIRRTMLDMGLIPEAPHVEAVLNLASGRSGRSISLPTRLRARSDGEYVRFSRPSLGFRA
jgi:tRNA(Ile)-lysidine synthase